MEFLGNCQAKKKGPEADCAATGLTGEKAKKLNRSVDAPGFEFRS
jgi:hypothetical protein